MLIKNARQYILYHFQKILVDRIVILEQILFLQTTQIVDYLRNLKGEKMPKSAAMIRQNFLKMVLLTSLLTPLIGCTTQDKVRATKSPEALTRMADSMKKSGDHLTAIHFYEQALQSNPDYADARLKLTALYIDAKQYDQAIDSLEAELKRNPNSQIASKELGKTYITAQLPEKGITHYKKMIHQYPDDPWALSGLAVCLDLDGQHGIAQGWYHKALEKDPRNVKIKSSLGLSLAISGNPQEAIDILLPLSQGSETNANVRHNLAIAYALNGNKELARTTFANDLTPEQIENNMLMLEE